MEEVVRQFDHRGFGNMHLQIAQKRARQPFVHQNAPVLRIIGEFDNIKRSVFGFNQVGLRTASHFADQIASSQRHTLIAMANLMEKDLNRKERKPRMAEENQTHENKNPSNPDEVALELMKFIAVTTGYGRGATTAAGFGAKGARSSEEFADSLLDLFERCRSVVRKQPK